MSKNTDNSVTIGTSSAAAGILVIAMLTSLGIFLKRRPHGKKRVSVKFYSVYFNSLEEAMKFRPYFVAQMEVPLKLCCLRPNLCYLNRLFIVT